MEFSTLVVEDDPSNLALLVQILKQRGHQVQSAVCAEDALSLAAEHHFDLMVVDWMLPGMDGLEFSRIVTDQSPNVTILVVTGRDSNNDLVRILSSGASDFLPKPYTPAALMVRLAVGESRARERRHRAQAEGELASIAQNLPDAVVFCDMNRKVIRVNRSFTRLTGYRVAEVVGRSTATFYESEQDWSEDAPRFGEQADHQPYERRYKRQGERAFLAENVTGPVNTPSGQIGWVTIFRDVSSRAEMTERLRMTDRLAQTGLLSGGIAHEISNPLTALLINLNLLQSELRDTDPEQRDTLTQDWLEMLGDAEQECHRVNRIVKSMRSFARDDNHRPEKVVLEDLVENALVILASVLRRRANVQTHYHPAPEVLAPPGDLGQVVLNLLKNAEEALQPGPTGTIHIRIYTHQGHAVLEVQDDGIGIAPEVQARMFDAFYSTKTGSSTGLGLATAQSITTRLGGVITCQSRPGQGALFRVRLPPA